MTLEEALQHCLDRRYFPDVFEDNVGLDVIIPGFITRPAWSGGERRVVLEVSSYIGISWNAIHYYGTLKIDGVCFSSESNPDCITICKETYEAEMNNCLADSKYSIDIVRPVTQEEIEEDSLRWNGYNIGDRTNAFSTKGEVINLAKEIFKVRFKGNWSLIIEDLT